MDGIESHPFHPEIEDDWLLVHQETDLKRPSLTSFFPKRGKGKGDREKALNSLSGFDYSQPSESYFALLTPRACDAASLMARCATPDVKHPIYPPGGSSPNFQTIDESIIPQHLKDYSTREERSVGTSIESAVSSEASLIRNCQLGKIGFKYECLHRQAIFNRRADNATVTLSSRGCLRSQSPRCNSGLPGTSSHRSRHLTAIIHHWYSILRSRCS
jgi:hypothetical protein